MRYARDHSGRLGHGIHVIIYGVHESLDEIRHGPLVPNVSVAADIGLAAGGGSRGDTRGRGQQRKHQQRGGESTATARGRRHGAVGHIIIWTRREFHIKTERTRDPIARARCVNILRTDNIVSVANISNAAMMTGKCRRRRRRDIFLRADGTAY